MQDGLTAVARELGEAESEFLVSASSFVATWIGEIRRSAGPDQYWKFVDSRSAELDDVLSGINGRIAASCK